MSVALAACGGAENVDITDEDAEMRSTMTPNPHRQTGFTLGELLVSMTVIALLLGIGVPSYNAVVLNARQVSSANELLSSMHLARDIAITRNLRVTMCPSASGNDCEAVSWRQGWIVFLDTNENGSTDPGETIERVVEAVDIPSITTAEFGNSLIFRPNGRAMTPGNIAVNAGEMVFCDDRGSRHARVAIIDMSGRPRVSKTTMNGDAPACPG